MPIKNRIAEDHQQIAAWRQELHQHPELLFDTHRTGAFVAEKLREFGCDTVETGWARTGVVGVIHGKQTSDRVVGLRADMDALPILEATGLPYASTTEGKMHACGHDGHTAMLLGAAKYLCETRHFAGTVIVIFQPAEEGGGGGEVMCQEGMMEHFKVDEVYGMHNMPGLPVGSFSIRSGAFFAACDMFEVTLKGRGGHAAQPHQTVDPVVASAQIVTALQSIVARNTDPLKQLVVSVCGLSTSSETHNVIPESVNICGTVRTLEPEIRALAEQRVREIISHIATGFGVEASINYERGYPSMINAERETQYAIEIAERVSGKQCPESNPLMGGEDFAYMLQERPGTYILVGNGESAGLHHPEYNFNDEAIPSGASYWAELAESRLAVA